MKPLTCELSSWTYFDIIGTDSEKFLQGQLSINAFKINQQQAGLAAVCNHKGRVVSLFYIYRIDAGFRIILPDDISQSTITHLKKYAVFFKVTIQAESALQQLFATNHLTSEDLDVNTSLIKINLTDFSIFIKDKKTFESQSGLNQPTTIQSISHQSITLQPSDSIWYWHLANQAIPWLSPDTVEAFLPHDLNLPKLDAVDFNKGCFTGQEIIARMQYKGKLKQHMHLFSCPQDLSIKPKDSIVQLEKKVAEIICRISLGTTNESQETLILALLKDRADKEQTFQLNLKNSPILELVK